jgi:hypothetical protein
MFCFGYFFGDLRAFMFPNNTNIHLNVNPKKLIKSLRLFISQEPHWTWGGIHEPPRKKGEKNNLTPHRPIGNHQKTRHDLTWSVGLLLWGTQFYSLLPMLKSSCTLNPKNPLYFIRLWIVLCFTQGGHLLCSGIKVGFLQWRCLPSTWGVRALSFPPSHVHSHLQSPEKAKCSPSLNFPQCVVIGKSRSALLAI